LTEGYGKEVFFPSTSIWYQSTISGTSSSACVATSSSLPHSYHHIVATDLSTILGLLSWGDFNSTD